MFTTQQQHAGLLAYLKSCKELPGTVTRTEDGTINLSIPHTTDGTLALSTIMIAQNPEMFGEDEARDAKTELKQSFGIDLDAIV